MQVPSGGHSPGGNDCTRASPKWGPLTRATPKWGHSPLQVPSGGHSQGGKLKALPPVGAGKYPGKGQATAGQASFARQVPRQVPGKRHLPSLAGGREGDRHSSILCCFPFRTELRSDLHKTLSFLCRFLMSIEAGYLYENPYHNAVHAADVLQGVHLILSQGQLLPEHADPLTHLACYVAAVSLPGSLQGGEWMMEWPYWVYLWSIVPNQHVLVPLLTHCRLTADRLLSSIYLPSTRRCEAYNN